MATSLVNYNVELRIFIRVKTVKSQKEGDTGICGVAVLMIFYCYDAVNRISICGDAVISNPSVCDACVFQAAVLGEMKLFAVLRFLVWSFSDLNLAS